MSLTLESSRASPISSRGQWQASDASPFVLPAWIRRNLSRIATFRLPLVTCTNIPRELVRVSANHHASEPVAVNSGFA